MHNKLYNTIEMGNSDEISVKIKSVQEICFSQNYIEDTSLLDEKLQFRFGLSLKADKKTYSLEIGVAIQYHLLDKMILECHYSVLFVLDGFDKVITINNDDSFNADDNFIATLLGIGIGTLRGVIIVKTAGTPLSNYPVPIVNPLKLLKRNKNK